MLRGELWTGTCRRCQKSGQCALRRTACGGTQLLVRYSALLPADITLPEAYTMAQAGRSQFFFVNATGGEFPCPMRRAEHGKWQEFRLLIGGIELDSHSRAQVLPGMPYLRCRSVANCLIPCVPDEAVVSECRFPLQLARRAIQEFLDSGDASWQPEVSIPSGPTCSVWEVEKRMWELGLANVHRRVFPMPSTAPTEPGRTCRSHKHLLPGLALSLGFQPSAAATSRFAVCSA